MRLFSINPHEFKEVRNHFYYFSSTGNERGCTPTAPDRFPKRRSTQEAPWHYQPENPPSARGAPDSCAIDYSQSVINVAASRYLLQWTWNWSEMLKFWLFYPFTCRSSGDPSDWPRSQPYKLPVEQKTGSRGCDSEKESCAPGEGTLGESDGEGRRWVDTRINKQQRLFSACKEVMLQ